MIDGLLPELTRVARMSAPRRTGILPSTNRSVGNEADHGRREGRFNVAFQLSAKLSVSRSGASLRFVPAAVADERRRKGGVFRRDGISCRPSWCIVGLLN
jgi:hypothetical protein